MKATLAEGAVVHASVRGRVLGIRLLTLDASVVIAPAEHMRPERLADDLPARAPRAELNGSHGMVGSHLADAVRLLDEL